MVRRFAVCYSYEVLADPVELLRRALEGHRTERRRLAEQLVDPIQREVVHCLLRFSAPRRGDARQEVRDLVQDVFVLLFENDARELRRWDPARGRSLESFVRLIARRRVARILARRAGHRWIDAPSLDDDPDLAAESTWPDVLGDRQQLDQILMLLTARMTERDQELFELLYVEEREPEEVARLLSMTRGAVNAWSYRLRKLARKLGATTDNPRLSPAAATKEASDG